MQQRKKKRIEDDSDLIPPLTTENLTEGQTDRREENEDEKIKLNK